MPCSTGGQFGYRDAGHFYYPLYQRVQAEWDAGRWPLWEPEENAGMPLLGNPTAAVLYPGKVIYASCPIPGRRGSTSSPTWSLAFVAMLCAMRSWGVSWAGSASRRFSYAFGAPILFQYCNIIYLVGAAWLPFGFLAVRALARVAQPAGQSWAWPWCWPCRRSAATRSRPISWASAAGLCGGAGLEPPRRAGSRDTLRQRARPARTRRWWLIPARRASGSSVWVAGTLVLAAWLPEVRPGGLPAAGTALDALRPACRRGCLGTARGSGFVWWWRRRGRRSPLGVMLVGLAGSAVLAAALAAAQLLPVLEFTQQTVRAAGEGPHDIYPFSLEPFRLAETGLAQRLRHELRPQRLLDRRAPDPRRPPEDLGAVALPRVASACPRRSAA